MTKNQYPGMYCNQIFQKTNKKNQRNVEILIKNTEPSECSRTVGAKILYQKVDKITITTKYPITGEFTLSPCDDANAYNQEVKTEYIYFFILNIGNKFKINRKLT